ncbi:MAG: hypothetical protein WBZ37_18295 [Mycobacterium sp.]
MSAVLHLLPDVGAGDDDGGLTVLEQWELYMRGAGRAERTVSDATAQLPRPAVADPPPPRDRSRLQTRLPRQPVDPV